MTESYEQYAKDLTSRVEYYNIGYAGKSYQRKLRDAFFCQERIDWVEERRQRQVDERFEDEALRAQLELEDCSMPIWVDCILSPSNSFHGRGI